MRIPAIIPLLIAGVALGPYGVDAFDVDDLFDDLLDPLVALSIGAILFDGALLLRRVDLGEGVGGVVTRLITLGVAITWGLAAAGAGLLLGLDHRIAILLGAILTLSGPTVVIPLLDFIRPTPKPASILRWEGILVDPIGAILAVVTFHAISSGEGSFDLVEFASTIAIGAAVGLAAAALVALLLRGDRFERNLVSTGILALVLLAVAGASELREDAGLVTAIVMGIGLAHHQRELVARAPEFGETLVSLLLGVLFVVLSARVDLADVVDLGLGGLAFCALLILIVRPLSTAVCTARSSTTRAERTLIAFMMPRGIVAAATASAFGLTLQQQNVPDAESLVPAVFLMIAVTVVVYGLAGRPLARRLGVAQD